MAEDAREAGRFVCSFMELLTIPETGRPMALMPWQREVITEFYGKLNGDGLRTYRYLYLEIPKKNGKSGLAAGLDAYLPGRHQGPCLTAYVALEDGGVVRTGKTTGRHIYQLTAMVPVDRPSDMTRLLRGVRAAMNTLPHLRAGDDSPDMIDEEKSAYCVTLEYSALCSA